MRRRLVCVALMVCSLLSAAQTPRRDGGHNRLEFPLLLQQRVVAGQTPVGSSVSGKLYIATLVRGLVIPAGAVFAGTVEESAARTSAQSSRLRVHVTQAAWDNKLLAVDLFLTNSAYRLPRQNADDDSMDGNPPRNMPLTLEELRDFQRQQAQPRRVGAPKHIWPQKTTLEDVSQERDAGGQVVLTSKKQNIRLDREGIYAFEGNAVVKPSSEHGK